ncbi:hypothetical protein TIN2_98 [Tsukamurella phage TIN2]|uniref:Uncharacterized protein n=1 Tax=Tsukamurella phage TIN2 TaxID=1636545 RepID=A0A0K0N5L4_9CAUD|nr:hypothetical protein AVT55_gp025 [Tsukamurella phage TIN2]AKJ71788.1 hypothetical protein TIN2_98 [Tsukamurella phage TIN2]
MNNNEATTTTVELTGRYTNDPDMTKLITQMNYSSPRYFDPTYIGKHAK